MMLVYGANGYTGRLISAAAAEAGLPVVLAGRSAADIRQLAEGLACEHRVFDLGIGSTVAAGIRGATLVLNCAGPFSRTFRPLSDACIAGGVHYVDITGEIEVFEALFERDAAARAAGVMLLPGAGFDVVPTDCLAAHLATRMPDAVRLQLGISGSGGLSRGTATTMIENQDRGGRVRRGGRIVPVPAAWKTRRIDFGGGDRDAVTIPWGDVATAYHSTGIPDIEVYAAAPRIAIRAMRVARHLAPLLRLETVKGIEKRLVRRGRAGPTEEELTHGTSRVWGRVENAAGDHLEARFSGPNGYRLTADAAIAIAGRILGGDLQPGFRTPSLAYGPDLALELPGTSRS